MTGSTPDDLPAVPQAAAVARRSARMTVYVTAMVAACLAIVAASVPSQYVSEAVFWIPLIAAANLSGFSVLPEVDLESTDGPIVIVAAALLFPPSAVVLFAFFGILYRRELRGEAPLVMSLFNRSMHALSGAAAAGVAALVYSAAGGASWQMLPAALSSVASYEIVNGVLLAGMLVIRRGRAWKRALAESINPVPRSALNVAMSAMLSLLIAVLVRDVGRSAVVLVVIPLWLSYSAQRSARVAQDRAEELAARVVELEMLNRMSGRLLVVRSADAVSPIVEAALGETIDRGYAWLAMDGTASGDDVWSVPIAGAEPASVVVRGGDVISRPVVEALASLIGLTLTRLQVEAELAETERARTALTGRILEEATHERSRIAMSMHDDVLPLFAAAQMQIDNAAMLLHIDDSERAVDVIEQATAGVSDGIRSLRDTLEALRESTLVPGTVVDGARKLLADLRARTGIRSEVEAPDPMPPLPFAVELLAYETLRGCLANVEKHSHATIVHVEFRVDDGRLVLHMRDDGRGFDPTTIGKRSHGLALMRQRAELARGSFDITGAPGAGSTARLEVPTW